MSDTKEKILSAALSLFARDGYEAVSVNMIAGELGITKGALYKHYKNKRHIFDSILLRMEEMDYQSAVAFHMPEAPVEDGIEAYRRATADNIKTYSKAQFRYWTEDGFASGFRKLITLEQYRSPEMSSLYQQYLGDGPMNYMADIFSEITGSPEKGAEAALQFYGPFFLLLSIYDSSQDKKSVIKMADDHIDNFMCSAPILQ